jgi:hypothetical protein
MNKLSNKQLREMIENITKMIELLYQQQGLYQKFKAELEYELEKRNENPNAVKTRVGLK